MVDFPEPQQPVIIYNFILKPVKNEEEFIVKYYSGYFGVTYPLLLGYYVNNVEIIRIGFLNLSSIYLIDKEGNFKILDTRRFNQGVISIHKELLYPIVPKNNSNAELHSLLCLTFVR